MKFFKTILILSATIYHWSAFGQTRQSMENHLNTALQSLREKNVTLWSSLYPNEVNYIFIEKQFKDNYNYSYNDSIIDKTADENIYLIGQLFFNNAFLSHFNQSKTEAPIYDNWGDLKMIDFDFNIDIFKYQESPVKEYIGIILFQSIENQNQYYLGKFDKVIFYQNQFYGIQISIDSVTDNNNIKTIYESYKNVLQEYTKSDFLKLSESEPTLKGAAYKQEEINVNETFADYEFNKIDTIVSKYQGTKGERKLDLQIINTDNQYFVSYNYYGSNETFQLNEVNQIDDEIFKIFDQEGYWLLSIEPTIINGVFIYYNKNNAQPEPILLYTKD